MIKKRLIFTLLFDSGKFVLSRNFSLQHVGDLDWLLRNYDFKNIASHIDELIILNIREKNKNFEKFCSILKKLSKEIFIPISAGGGIISEEKVNKILRSGADKIVCNSIIRKNKGMLKRISKIIGKQSIIGSLDLKLIDNNFFVFDNNSLSSEQSLDDFLKDLDTDLFGELYLNSVDRDGTGQGYMIEMVQKFKKLNNFPIIIAGGAGNWRHLLSGLKNKDINAVSTANLLNFIGDGFKQARIELTKRFDLPKW